MRVLHFMFHMNHEPHIVLVFVYTCCQAKPPFVAASSTLRKVNPNFPSFFLFLVVGYYFSSALLERTYNEVRACRNISLPSSRHLPWRGHVSLRP